VDKYQHHLSREIKRLWKVEARVIPVVIGDTKRSGGKLENIGNNYKSWIDSESRTPRKSTNTKKSTGAWLEDSVIQLGVGTLGGCEAAIQWARRSPETMPADQVVVKIYFPNLLNCLHRSDMLKLVTDRAPGLLSYCHSTYTNPSVHSYGQHNSRVAVWKQPRRRSVTNLSTRWAWAS